MANWLTRQLWPFAEAKSEVVPVPEAQPSVAAPSTDAIILPHPRLTATRSLDAGLTDRITRNWSTADMTLNSDLYRQLRSIRNRSRAFVVNSEYGARFMSLLRKNVVGPTGFALSVQAKFDDGSLDVSDSELIEKAFEVWTRRENCSPSGKHSFLDLQHLIICQVARDGEVLVRKVYGRGPHGFQLEIIPAHLLDEQHNVDLPNGNVIRMGVELDEWGAPVAYHLRDARAQDITGASFRTGRYQRVPASEMFHLFVDRDGDQYRGLPWAATALRNAHFLDQFIEAAVVAANVGAMQLGVIQTTDGTLGGLGDNREANGFSVNTQPGSFFTLPPGYSLQKFDPDYPHPIFASFVKTFVQATATALDVSYVHLANDLEGVSYSSIRAGEIDQRDGWKTIQSWFVDAFLRPVFADWLSHAMMTDRGLIKLPQWNFDKFNSPVWQGRRWDWVDPANEMQAADMAIQLGIKSRQQIMREQGVSDPERVWQELEHENDRLSFLRPVAAVPPAPEDK